MPTTRKASVLNLESLGWNPEFEKLRAELDPNWEVGRIVRQDVNRFLVLGPNGEESAILRGRARANARIGASHQSRPSVGDWVAVKYEGCGTVVIEHVFERKSAFVRKVAGETTEGQTVAANVDTVFLVMGLDEDFNPRRIERYLTATWESGANPVIVLNKVDASETLQTQVATIEAVALGVSVIPISALTKDGIEALDPWLGPGQTVALLGSSGVGKSTLVNTLVGSARQEMGDVREFDSKGRHTTTHRELVPLPGGALLIDTPGMRELQLWGTESGLDDTFPEISNHAAECKFQNCEHRTEPNCAVLAAIEQGEIDPVRLASWRKLQRELQYLANRQDARARSEQKAKWKHVSKTMKHHPKTGRWKKLG